MINKLSIIIPAFNEEQTINEALKMVDELVLIDGIAKEIVVIDDCSTDQTEAKIKIFQSMHPDSSIVRYHQKTNKGKGAAIHKGIELCTGDYIVIQDADLELNPSDINKLIAGLEEKDVQVVYGSRFLKNDHQNTKFVWHIMGNGFLTRMSNLFTGFKLTDMMTCYKLIPSELLKSINLKENRFGFEPEITLKLSKVKAIKVHEVPVSYIARDKVDGKKISSKDGIRVIYCILKYYFFK